MKYRDKKMAFPRREEDATFYILYLYDCLFHYSSCPYVAARIEWLAGLAHSDSVGAAGVDETEVAFHWVVVHHDSHVAYRPAGPRTGEEHEVAHLEIVL